MTSSAYWLWYRNHTERTGLPTSAEAHDIYVSVKSRLERCLLGYQWLRLRFPATKSHTPSLDIRPRLASVSDPTVTDMSLKSIFGSGLKYAYDDADEARDYICEVDLPESWFNGPVDGLLGIRLLRAGLYVLDMAGQELGIGMPKLLAVKSNAALPADDRPFDATGARIDPRERAHFRWVEDRYNSLESGGVLLVGRRDAGEPERRRQEAVADALSGHSESTYEAEGVRLSLWTAPGPV
jgi:hypothetical protein